MKKSIILKSKVKKVLYCNSILAKGIGLMFSMSKDLAMVFVFNREKSVSLHMFFVFYPIDIFWLDKDKKVTAFQKRCMPFTLVRARPAQYIIEAKSGLLNLKINDRIVL